MLCLVMHSFSFVERRDGQWHSRRPDIDRFLWLLDTLKAQQAQVVRMRTLSVQSLAGEEAADRAVPALRTSWLHTYGRAVQRAHRSRKMAVLAIAPWLVAAVCVTAWVVYGRIG